MKAQLTTRHGYQLAIDEDRELAETCVPRRLAEVIAEFAEAQRLGRKRWIPPQDRYRFFDVDHIAEENRRFYADLRADPVRWTAWLEFRRAYIAERRRRDAEFLEKERAWRRDSYARLKADANYLPERNRKQRNRYAEMRADPAQRERYERVKAAARARYHSRKAPQQ